MSVKTFDNLVTWYIEFLHLFRQAAKSQGFSGLAGQLSSLPCIPIQGRWSVRGLRSKKNEEPGTLNSQAMFLAPKKAFKGNILAL